MKIWQHLFKKHKQLHPQLAEDLLKKVQKEVAVMPPINIVVVGKTGSGKSTLINALFRENIATTGEGLPITQGLMRLSKEGIPLTLYDTKGLELTADSQRVVVDNLQQLIQQHRNHERQRIHLAYYCLNSSMGRIETFEIDLIKALAAEIPVILVLTQTLNRKDNRFQIQLDELNLPVKAIIPVLAKPLVLENKQLIPSSGLQSLIDMTLKQVPSEVHRAFINAQQIDIQRKIVEARRWAKNYVKSAFGIGFIPIPIADATLLVPMQITMLAHLTAIFGVALDKAQIISILASIGGTGGATYFGKLIVSSTFKLIPGLGTLASGVVTGTTAGIMTLGLGYAYIEVLRQITLAEMTGRDIHIKELQRIMTRSFQEQMSILNRALPSDLKQKLLPSWLNDFVDRYE